MRETNVVAGGLGEDVLVLEGVCWERELGGEDAEHEHAQVVRVVLEGLDEVGVSKDVRGVRASGGEVVEVVFGDVEEFGRVRAEVGVGLFDRAGSFVAEEGDTADEMVLVFVFEGVIKGAVGELQEVFGFLNEGLTGRSGVEVEIEEAMGSASFESGGSF